MGLKSFIEKQAQRLGNLTILPPGVNASAGNKSFLEKKNVYEKHRHLKLVDEILAKEDWDQAAMEERENRLIAWAAKECAIRCSMNHGTQSVHNTTKLATIHVAS